MAIKIAIAGFFGFGNVGDEAVLSGTLRSLKRFFSRAGFSAFSASPSHTSRAHGVVAVGHGVGGGVFSVAASAPALEKEISSADVFILGGGGILHDLKPHVLPLLLGASAYAKKRGAFSAIYCAGVSPIKTGLGRFLCSKIINSLDFVSVRDFASKKNLAAAGVDECKVRVFADPAFAAPFSPRSKARIFLKKLGVPAGKPVVGVTFVPYFKFEDYWSRNSRDFSGELEVFASALNELKRETGASLVVVPTVSGDIAACKQLCEKSGAFLADCGGDHGLADSLFSQFDLTVGMRMHSLIFSARHGTPFIAVPYDEKVSSLCGALGWSFSWRMQDGGSALAFLAKKILKNKRALSKRVLAASGRQRALALNAARELSICFERARK